MTDARRFTQDVRANRNVRAIFERWDALRLPDGWLVAGCLFQTVWNLQDGRAPESDILDYDLFYHDPSDLSEAAERRVQQRAEAVLGDLGITVEAKNQARVHLWYEEYFGHPYPRLDSSAAGIARFLVLCTCVGLRPAGGEFELCAPHGLRDLYSGRLEANPLTARGTMFEDKAASYRARWPWLDLVSGSASSRVLHAGHGRQD